MALTAILRQANPRPTRVRAVARRTMSAGGPLIKHVDTPRSNSDRELRASVGSTEAAKDAVARVGRIDRSMLGPICFGVSDEWHLENRKLLS